MKPVILLLLISCLLYSCKKTETDTNPFKDCPYAASFVPMTDQGILADGLIPLKLNTGWAYADSTWQDGILVNAGTYDLYVDSAARTGDDIWWKLSDGYILCEQNDTVYKLNFNGEVQAGFVSCPEKTVLYYGVPENITFPWYEVSGDVLVPGNASVSKEVLSTPSGPVSYCYKFSTESQTRYICPGLGIVKIVSFSPGVLNIKTMTGIHTHLP